MKYWELNLSQTQMTEFYFYIFRHNVSNVHKSKLSLHRDPFSFCADAMFGPSAPPYRSTFWLK